MITLSPPVAGLTRRLLAESWRVTRWICLTGGVVAIVLAVVFAQFTPLRTSVWEQAPETFGWFVFVVGITVTMGYFPLAVAHGVTRRGVLTAFALTGLAMSLLWAVVLTTGLVIERAAYSWLGWAHTLHHSHPFGGGDNAAGMLAENLLICLSFLASGSLIGAVFYRYARSGYLLLPVAMLPVAALESVLSSSWRGTIERGFSLGPEAVLVVVIVPAAIALVGMMHYLLLRDVPIRGKTS
jgi:hypothetical protein